jgi:hypothetical protein
VKYRNGIINRSHYIVNLQSDKPHVLAFCIQVTNLKMTHINRLNFKSFFRTNRSEKKANLGMRLGACFLLLIVLMSMMNAVESNAASAGQTKPAGDKLKVVDLNSGIPAVVVSDGSDNSKPAKYDLTSDCVVMLNQGAARLGDLKPGDEIIIKTDEQGRAIDVSAYRTTIGIVSNSPDDRLAVTTDYLDKYYFGLANNAKVMLNNSPSSLNDLKPGDEITIYPDNEGKAVKVLASRKNILIEFWDNFRKNLFKPLLLFFYLGFIITLLKVAFEFPYAIYQGLTIYLLLAIGWHGGEELAVLSGKTLQQAISFMTVGFMTNVLIGLIAYGILRFFIPRMRKIDAATVSAYYGSDSAGTFLTCVGALQLAHIAYAAYMPVMLAVMEIPGCLVGLYLVSQLRKKGMDQDGNMPDEPGYDPVSAEYRRASVGNSEDKNMAEALRELFFNPGIFLLFGGILIGFISRLQGHTVVQADDQLFVTLFQGMLSLFLLEMGVTAATRLKDLKVASWKFIAFGLIMPNIFATFGIIVALTFSHIIHQPLQLGTYVLFAALCAAASYIAVPAIQRLAIPEASPTLPLAASLGLTFSYNVTIGIPLYIVIAQNLITKFPVLI